MKSIKNYSMIAMAAVGLSVLPCQSQAMDVAGVDVHGFISQGFLASDTYNYLASDSEDGSFQYNEFGINFSKEVSDKLRVGLQLFSRDLGDVANNTVTIDWAYGDYRWKDWLGIRAGRMKAPGSLYNETRDMDMLRVSIVMPQSVYNDLLRDSKIAINGVGVYGNVPASSAGSFDYQVQIGTTNIDKDSGTGKYLDNSFRGFFTVEEDPEVRTVVVGSLRWNTPLDGLLLATNGYVTETDTDVNYTPISLDTNMEQDISVINFGLEYTWEDLVVAAEYQLSFTDSKVESLSYSNDNTSEGLYLSASYRVNEWFQLGSYYSVYYADKDNHDGNGGTFKYKSDAWEKDLALSLRFDITDNWIIKLEGHAVNGTAFVMSADNSDRPEEDFYYAAAKVTFSF